MSHRLVVIGLIIILIHQVAGRSTGPPNAACADITPQHSPNSPSTCPQPCPYSLQVTAINGVSVGPLTGSVAYASSSDSFQIAVVTTGENVFRGFAVQSRTSTNTFDTNAAFQGGFDNVDSDSLWQLIACTGSNTATAGHTSSVDKSQVTLYWSPPSIPDNVTLWFSIVAQYNTYYVQMEGLIMTSAVFCSGSPCQNGGTCVESNGNYTCINCNAGFTGQNCHLLTGVNSVTSVNGRATFVIGEEVSLMCNTIPSDLSVTWEVRRDASTYVAVNDSLVRYEPPSLRTVLRFNISSINAGGGYRCRGTGQLENDTSDELGINVLPETLSLRITYTIGETTTTTQIYLVNRSAFALPSQSYSQLTIFCLGILGDDSTELTSTSITVTLGTFTNYVVVNGSLDTSGDFVGISFSTFLDSYSGNYTCRSRTSSTERAVLISSNSVAFLLSSRTVQVPVGENATFVYRIALTGDVDVVDNVQVFFTNTEGVSGADVSMIVGQGNDIYHVIFPISSSQIGSTLDQAEFDLQFSGLPITNRSRIDVLFPPTISPEVMDQTQNETDTASFSCRATGEPVPTISWYFNDVPVDVTNTTKYTVSVTSLNVTTNSSTLTIMNVQSSDVGTYTCNATNVISSDTSSGVLTVNVSPNIASPAEGQEYIIIEGRNGSITCTATGYPPPTVVWLDSGGIPLSDGRLVFGGAIMSPTGVGNVTSVSVELIVTGAMRVDTGMYTCSASNGISSTNRNISIRVQFPPTISPEVMDQTQNETDTASFSCRATGEPVPTISWYFNDVPVDVTNTTKYTVSVTSLNVTTNSSTLTIMNVQSSDVGTYTCNATNVISSDTSSGVLTVNVPPNITSLVEGQEVNITEGSDGTVTCTATGYPLPMVIWQDSDGNLFDANSLSSSTGIGNVSRVSVDLSLTGAMRTSTGTYTCLASNILGMVSRTITIIVQFPPTISLEVMDQTQNETDTASFTCQATGEPVPTISWYFNVVPVDVTNTTKYTVSVTSLNVTTNSSTLTIMNVQSSDVGTYTCNATNIISSDTSSGILTAIGLSAPPQNITVMVISSTSLTVSWDPPPLADQNGVTSYQVRISTVNSIPASSNTVNLGGTSYIAVGLDEFQEYDIEVASVTALGVGPFSTPIRTQTLEDVPSVAPNNVSVTVVSSRSIQLSWNPPEIGEQNGILLHYHVIVMETQILFLNDGTLIAPMGDNLNRTYDVSEGRMQLIDMLHPSYNYTVRIAAATAAGIGPFSDPITVMTLEDAPTEVPLNVNIIVETSRNISLSWDRPSLQEQNGILTIYHVIIMETQILYLDSGTVNTPMGDNFNRTYNVSEGRMQLIDMLHPSYNYTVRIAAATAAGIGPFSDPITVMTLEDVPTEAPLNVTVSVETSRSIMLSWDQPSLEEHNGVLTVYHVIITETQMLYLENGTVISQTGMSFNRTYNVAEGRTQLISMLQPSYNYTVRIAAATGAGIGPFSDPITVMTFEDNTPPVLELLSPQPIRIYGRRSGILTILINATVTDATGSTVRANSSLLNVSLITSDGTTGVMISSYDSETGRLVLSVPAEFYNSYVNATFNTSYFEITLRSPTSSLVSSISFAAEYLDVHDVVSVNGRETFALGEEIFLMCNTIPSNISVTWEVQRDGEFEAVNDTLVQYEPSSLLRTVLRFTALTASYAQQYRCRGTGELVNVTSDELTIDILPESLTLFISYMINEGMANPTYLVNRTAFALPSSLTQSGGTLVLRCFGILGDINTEMLSNSINTTVGFTASDYSINRTPLDLSGDSVNIFFNTFSNSYSGNYTCRSRTSGAERTVFVSSATVATLLSPGTVRVVTGEDAVFVYRIALPGDDDVLENVQVVVTNVDVSGADVSMIVEQGNDIYHVIFPQVGSVLDQATVVLEYNEFAITSIVQIAILPSNIIVSPERFAVNSVGDDVLLSCTPSNTAISIIWYKGSELLTTSTKYTFSPAGRQHNLTINNAQHNDSGSYYCVFADSEIREDLKFDVIIIQDPIAMTLNGVTLPPLAVLNNPGIPSSLVVMCIGTEGNRQLELKSSSNPLPNPVVPGVYQSTFDSIIFNVVFYDGAIIVSLSNVGELPSFESFNCTSLESSARTKLFVTSEILVVASLEDNIDVYYGQPFTVLYTVATSSNGTDNLDNNTVPDLIVEFTSFDSGSEPIILDTSLVTVEFGNLYRLTMPTTSSSTGGMYTLRAELFGGEVSSSATVSVRTILPQLSTVGVVYELEGHTATLNCTISFPGSMITPAIPITWYQFDGEQYTDASLLDNAMFLTPELASSLLLESVSVSDTGTFVCAIVEDIGGEVEERIVETTVDLFVFENEINVGYNSRRLLPSGTVINQFGSLSRRSIKKRNAIPSEPVGALTLDCITVTGQENPYWEISNNVIFNGTIMPNLTVSVADGEIEATIFVVPVSLYITTIALDTFESELSGTYTCRSSPDGPYSSVVLTDRDPYVRSLTPSPLQVAQCQLFNLTFRVARSSDGLFNAIEVVMLEQFQNDMSVANFTISGEQQLYSITFLATSLREGEYFAYLPPFFNERSGIEVNILYPEVTLLTDNDVVVLSGNNVTLGCTPTDPTLQIRWVYYNEDGTVTVLSPNNNDDDQKRLAVQPTIVFNPPGLYHQITMVNVTLMNSGTYSCEVVPSCNEQSPVTFNMTVIVVPEIINIGYDTATFLPSGTIINSFVPPTPDSTTQPPTSTTPPPTGTPPSRRSTKQKRNSLPSEANRILTLDCIAVPGQENPYWELSNNQFFNGTLRNNLSIPIEGGELEATIFINPVSRYVTVISFNIFPPPLSGNYTCRSTTTGPSSSVEITTRNPVVRAVTSSPLIVPQCQTANFTIQAAQDSNGVSNSVGTILAEVFRNGENVVNLTLDVTPLSTQLFQHGLSASSILEGLYYFYLPINPGERASVELQVIYPILSLLTNEEITVLRGDDVIFECIPSDLGLTVRWRFYNTEGANMIIGPGRRGDDRFSKRQTTAPTPPALFEPPGLYHRFTFFNVPLSASGVYSCEILSSCPDTLVIAQNTSLTVTPACDETFEVILWPKTPVSSTAMIRCAEIHSSFSFGPYATRRCNEGEMWSVPDFSNCTVRSGSTPLAVVSVRLGEMDESEERPNASFIQQMALESLDDIEGITVMVEVFEDDRGEFPVSIVVDLFPGPVNSSTVMVVRDYFDAFGPYGDFSKVAPLVVTVFEPNDTCSCNVLLNTENDEQEETGSASLSSLYTTLDVCIGPALGPCVCSTTECECNSPAYTGTGSLCGRDSDRDTLPDVGLECEGLVCEEDLCPLMPSLSEDSTSQDGSVCMPPTDQGQPNCAEDTDDFSLTWPLTAADRNTTLPCSGGIGTAYRYCNLSGDWQPSIVRECRSYEYVAITQEAQALSTAQPQQIAEISPNIVNNLVTITEPEEDTSVLPLDLGAVVDVLDTIISVTNLSEVIEQEEYVNNVLEVYNNVLNSSNTPGWMELQEVNRTQSQLLLLNAEQFSLQWASTLNVSENRTMSTENIIISVEAVDVDSGRPPSDVLWPTPELLEEEIIFKGSAPSAFVMIPSSLIQLRGLSSENGVALIANTAYRNFASILPSSVNTSADNDTVIQSVSLVLSSQVDPMGRQVPLPGPSIRFDPIVLIFDYSTTEFEEYDNLRCGFWDFNLEQESGVPPGGWSSIGLSIENSTNTTITCTSTHLTSFAVLVDVSGSSQGVSAAQRKALSIVSYIGCAISLLCLIAAIIMFIIYRNTLLKGIHNFIHLNLTIALALALLVFVIGIETATESKGGCAFVAALLHYFFTCVFMWMLCEGIMLYFLLVQVFNIGLGQKKLFYLTIGWVTPLPIVAIAVGIAHDQYGTSEYCWISTDEGAIWAFVAPMLVIILANVVFLCLAIRAVYKSKARSTASEDTINVELARAVLKATVVLLPLLGITWVFGILAVNEESVAFAWIFTILNSLQGAFIFVLHVLRNEKVKDRLKSYFGKRSKYSVTSTGGYSTATTSKGGTTKSNKAFTVKIKATTDVELGSVSKDSLDDSKMENVFINPLTGVAEEEDENKESSN